MIKENVKKFLLQEFFGKYNFFDNARIVSYKRTIYTPFAISACKSGPISILRMKIVLQSSKKNNTCIISPVLYLDDSIKTFCLYIFLSISDFFATNQAL